MFLFVALFGYGFLTDGSWLARTIIILSIPLAFIRFFGAARHLARYGTTLQYTNFWWQPLWDEATWQANEMASEEAYANLRAAGPGRASPNTASEQLALSMFRDLVLAGDSSEPEAGARIPQRRRRLFGRAEISGEGEGFLTQMRLNADRTRLETPFVPFRHYWPTYANMTRDQQAWYFHWRTQLRQGKLLPTTLSYIMVHAYELVNLIGVTSAQEGFDQLAYVWKSYRDEAPDLDKFLVNWCADMLVVHQLPMPVMDWYAQMLQYDYFQGDDEDLLLEAWVQSGSDFDLLNMELIYRMCGYTPKRNKFYQVHHEEIDFEGTFRLALSAVDEHLRQQGKQGLFASQRVGKAIDYIRVPFSGAIHQYDIDEIRIAQVRPWTESGQLALTLASIIRQAENVLRTEASFRSQLRDVTVPAGWDEVIRAAIVAPPPERTVEIDLAHAERIRLQSETVRQRLIVEEEPSPTAAPSEVMPVAEPAESKDNVPPNMRATVQSGAPANLAGIIGDADSEPARLLAHLRENGWQSEQSALEAAFKGTFVSVVLDQINEAAYDSPGESLLFEEDGRWIVADEYRDEIAETLDHLARRSEHDPGQIEPAARSGFDELAASIDDEWFEFAARLKPVHWGALLILSESQNVHSKLDAVARTVHSTANQLIDQINEHGLETIGDTIIETADDPPIVIDEYTDPVAEMVAWAVRHRKLETVS